VELKSKQFGKLTVKEVKVGKSEFRIPGTDVDTRKDKSELKKIKQRKEESSPGQPKTQKGTRRAFLKIKKKSGRK